MSIFQWDDSLSIGIIEIHMQHKKLVESLNDLTEAMRQRKGREVVGRIINDMVQYVGEINSPYSILGIQGDTISIRTDDLQMLHFQVRPDGRLAITGPRSDSSGEVVYLFEAQFLPGRPEKEAQRR